MPTLDNYGHEVLLRDFPMQMSVPAALLMIFTVRHH